MQKIRIQTVLPDDDDDHNDDDDHDHDGWRVLHTVCDA